MANAIEIYEGVNKNIIKALESGTPPWEKPWFVSQPSNPVSGVKYSGVNYLNLISVASNLNIESADLRFVTFKQAQTKGWSVRRGSKAVAQVIFFSMLESDNQDEAVKNPLFKETFPLLKQSSVFHASQIEGIPEFEPLNQAFEFEPNALAERIVLASLADIRTNPRQAYYSPVGDYVSMPPKESFKSVEAYYGTLLHELGHWTGHNSRLDRGFENTFSKEERAFEELRVEIASLYLMSESGIQYQAGNHNAYIENWLKLLKADKLAIKKASTDAMKISKYLLSLAKVESIQNADI
jgi:putative DNA primase/helicase